jgi:hypothetical protein
MHVYLVRVREMSEKRGILVPSSWIKREEIVERQLRRHATSLRNNIKSKMLHSQCHPRESSNPETKSDEKYFFDCAAFFKSLEEKQRESEAFEKARAAQFEAYVKKQRNRRNRSRKLRRKLLRQKIIENQACAKNCGDGAQSSLELGASPSKTRTQEKVDEVPQQRTVYYKPRGPVVLNLPSQVGVGYTMHLPFEYCNIPSAAVSNVQLDSHLQMSVTSPLLNNCRAISTVARLVSVDELKTSVANDPMNTFSQPAPRYFANGNYFLLKRASWRFVLAVLTVVAHAPAVITILTAAIFAEVEKSPEEIKLSSLPNQLNRRRVQRLPTLLLWGWFAFLLLMCRPAFCSFVDDNETEGPSVRGIVSSVGATIAAAVFSGTLSLAFLYSYVHKASQFCFSQHSSTSFPKAEQQLKSEHVLYESKVTLYASILRLTH